MKICLCLHYFRQLFMYLAFRRVRMTVKYLKLFWYQIFVHFNLKLLDFVVTFYWHLLKNVFFCFFQVHCRTSLYHSVNRVTQSCLQSLSWPQLWILEWQALLLKLL